jgi:hypothetical protein
MANKLIGYAGVDERPGHGPADRSTCSDCPKNIPGRGGNLSVLNLGGGNVGTGTPMGSMVFTVMTATAAELFGRFAEHRAFVPQTRAGSTPPSA